MIFVSRTDSLNAYYWKNLIENRKLLDIIPCSFISDPKLTFPQINYTLNAKSITNAVIRIQDEKCLQIITTLVRTIHYSTLHYSTLISLDKPIILYLRGSATFYRPIEPYNTPIYLPELIPEDLNSFVNNLLVGETTNPQIEILNGAQNNGSLIKIEKLGFYTNPYKNLGFVYTFLPYDYILYNQGFGSRDKPKISKPLPLSVYYYNYCQNIFYDKEYLNAVNPSKTYYENSLCIPTHIVIDNFKVIDKGDYKEINKLCDEVELLNKLGKSVIIITRNNLFESGERNENLFPFYFETVFSHRGKQSVNVHTVRSPSIDSFYTFPPLNTLNQLSISNSNNFSCSFYSHLLNRSKKTTSFIYQDGYWTEQKSKYEDLYPSIATAFNDYGMSAGEIKKYIKDRHGKDISLATLSKLLLKMGLRRNKYNKRRKRRIK